MKKIIVSFSLLLSAGLSTAFANGVISPDQRTLDAFKKEFRTAQNVNWEEQDGYDKATFMLGGNRVVAYFGASGEMEGCARDISFDQLPLAVMTAVDKKYSGATILNVIEINNANGTSYKVRLATAKKKLSIKVNSSGSIDEIVKLEN